MDNFILLLTSQHKTDKCPLFILKTQKYCKNDESIQAHFLFEDILPLTSFELIRDVLKQHHWKILLTECKAIDIARRSDDVEYKYSYIFTLKYYDENKKQKLLISSFLILLIPILIFIILYFRKMPN